MSTGLLLPFLAALMILYITDGTLAAQRMILGMMAALGLYLYLAYLTNVGEYAVNSEEAKNFGSLISQSLRPMAAMVISFSLDIFLIPIVYQGLRNLRCRLFLSVMGALLVVQLTDALIFNIICHLGRTDWWKGLADSYFARTIATLWLSAMSSWYLARIGSEKPGDGRNALDIVIAFFGNYGKAKILEENLRVSEERYRLLFANASDMVLVIDENGNIRNANEAAVRLTGLTQEEIASDVPFTTISGILPDIWSGEKMSGQPAPVNVTMPRTKRIVEVTFTPFHPSEASGIEFIVFGRDVTERIKLDREIAEWREKTEHNQRLESIGRLAGGIAHDFNNYLHAIQGHLDIIRYMHEIKDEGVARSLSKIDSITEKAALLTKQMLGFARKGNYARSIFDPSRLIRSTVDLLTPDAPSSSAIQVEMKHIPQDSGLLINGDMIQIQQALLNILLNARDAMSGLPENRRIIRIDLARMNELDGFSANPPGEAAYTEGQEYCVIRIADSGPGIPEAVINRIFEPFFTTKPVGKGTGMGLSMAYGSMLTHQGWLQCRNGAEGGAVFEMVFPLVKTPAE